MEKENKDESAVLANREGGSLMATRTGVNFSRGGTTLERTILATRDLPRDVREPLRWLAKHMVADRLTVAGLVRRGVPQPSGKKNFGRQAISFALTAAGNVSLENVCWGINKYREKWDVQQLRNDELPFVQTPMARRIYLACGRARRNQRILFLVGDTQSGKTRALREVERAEPDTLFIECPEGGGYRPLLAACARAIGVSPTISTERLRDRFLNALEPGRTLLIFDEMHEAFTAGRTRGSAMRAMGWIKHIYNQRGVGIVMAGTSALGEELIHGPYKAELLQLVRRKDSWLSLPDRPTAAALREFAKAAGLPGAPTGKALDLQKLVLQKEGLGCWLSLLVASQQTARNKHEKFGWGHVLTTHAVIVAMEGGAE